MNPETNVLVADIKALTISEPSLVKELGPAFQKYNEEQFITAKLPGSSEPVIVSSHNSLGDGRYYDVESSTSFEFDHATQKASGAQSHSLESAHSDLVYVLAAPLVGDLCADTSRPTANRP